MEGITGDHARLYLLLDSAILLRALYTFTKSYFHAKFNKQALANNPHNTHGIGTAQQQPAIPIDLPAAPERRQPVRIYMDGCFDMMHFGHANALRQAANLGDHLVVGLCPDSEILDNKGPPVMNDHERFVAVQSVKWVDEVITGVPYNVSAEFMQHLFQNHQIDYVVHGDDPCFDKDGKDVYAEAKRMGKMKIIKRTEGVSSTDIVGRMLLCTRDHHLEQNESRDIQASNQEASHNNDRDKHDKSPPKNSEPSKAESFARVSTFLPTTRRLIQFADGARAPKPNDTVVYMDGGFDMFHCGHIETLRKAKELGDFLLVGIHDDATVNTNKGRNFPIMNLHERTLSVLSCKHVDEVIIGAPWAVSEDMIKTMNISKVVRGTHWDLGMTGTSTQSGECQGSDPYTIARQKGIYVEVESESDLSVSKIIDRIVTNRDEHSKKHQRKTLQEKNYLDSKEYVEEI